VRKEGFRVGPLVDPFEAHRPAAGAEVSRVPGKAPRAVLGELIAQGAGVALVRKLQHPAQRQPVECFEDLGAALSGRKGARVEDDGRWSIGHERSGVCASEVAIPPSPNLGRVNNDSSPPPPLPPEGGPTGVFRWLREHSNRALDVLAVLLIAFAVWRIFVAPRLFAGKLVAVAAPPVTAPLMDGGKFVLARSHGHVVFLDFWASWCEPCKMSIPLIARYEKSHPDATVISIDAGESISVATRFASLQKMKNVAFDPDMAITHAFGVEVFPTMIVIDPDGKQRAKWIGFNPLIEDAMANAAKTFAGG
jgi:thiol-disulfide isomerase/thioredoxin